MTTVASAVPPSASRTRTTERPVAAGAVKSPPAVTIPPPDATVNMYGGRPPVATNATLLPGVSTA